MGWGGVQGTDTETCSKDQSWGERIEAANSVGPAGLEERLEERVQGSQWVSLGTDLLVRSGLGTSEELPEWL